MKPNFALSLSFEGIRLLHRAAGGWRIVGDVSLDTEDIVADLAVLRKSATALEPGGLRVKLLLPDAQIKYLTLDTPQMSDDARREAARTALDGATPYAVTDLAFDISADGPRTHVAAVARETLAEAEAFAVEHRFHPVSFVGVPGDHPYLGEPFFGPTVAAADLLEDGETVEPDGIAVVVIGEVAEPKTSVAVAQTDATPEPEPEPEPEQNIAEPPETKAKSMAGSEPEDQAGPADPEPAKVTADTQTKAPEVQSDPVPDLVAPVANDPPAAAPEAMSEPAAAEQETARDNPATPPLQNAARAVPPAPPLVPAEDIPAKAAVAIQELAVTASASETSQDVPEPATAKKPPQDAKPTVPPAPPLVLAEKAAPLEPLETPQDVVPALPPLRAARKGSDPKTDIPPITATPTGFASRRKGAAAPSLGSARREPLVSAAPLEDRTTAAVILPDSSSLNPDPAPADPAAQAKPSASKMGFLSRRKKISATQASDKKTILAAPALPGGVASSEAERMTVFGARRGEIGGKPRFLGLILTAALLIFLAGIAAWASVFMDDGLKLSRLFGSRSEPEIIAAPDNTPTAEQPAPKTEDPVRTAALDAGLTEEDGAVLDALREPILATQSELSEAELEAKYAATGIWPRAPVIPPAPVGLIDIDDLYLTSIDPVSTAADAIALPSLDSLLTDAVFDDISNPAAAGTQFAFDDRGLVIPTAAGTLNPDGITVYLGAPDVLPPATLARFQPPAEQTPVLDALAGSRPKTRPGGLVENAERAQFDGLTRNELADYRPALRPPSIQEQAVAAAETAAPVVTPQDTADAVAQAMEVPAQPAAFENPTRLAAAVSARPDTRPRNFERIVKRAERSAPAQETKVASAAAVAPRTVSPKIPSSASVARQATVKNAINLRKVNLIGVYGKPSNRRALVRLGNGRYQKVVVGDRIDGGRVSAIGDGELRYTKSGRSVILKMPQG